MEGDKDVRELKEAPKREVVEDRAEKIRRRLSRLNAGLMSLE